MVIIAAISLIAMFLYLKWDRKNSLMMKEERERRETEERRRKDAENEELMAQTRRLLALGEAMQQAEAMGDWETKAKIERMEYDGVLPEQREDGLWMSIYDDLRMYKISGMKYRGNLKAYVGKFKGVLVPEPKNEYDQYAIQVKCEDGKLLGYIKENQTDKVRYMVGAEQPLGEEKPTIFKPYKVTGWIEEEGEEGYRGVVYVRRKKE